MALKSGSTTVGSGTTDASGFVQIGVVSFGSYTIEVTKTNYQTHTEAYSIATCPPGGTVGKIITIKPATGYAVIPCSEAVSTSTTFDMTATITRTSENVNLSATFTGTLAYDSQDANGVGLWAGNLTTTGSISKGDVARLGSPSCSLGYTCNGTTTSGSLTLPASFGGKYYGVGPKSYNCGGAGLFNLLTCQVSGFWYYANIGAGDPCFEYLNAGDIVALGTFACEPYVGTYDDGATEYTVVQN